MNEKYQTCLKCKKEKKLAEFRYRGGLQVDCKYCAGLSSSKPQYIKITKQQAVEAISSVLANKDNDLHLIDASKLSHVIDFIERLPDC